MNAKSTAKQFIDTLEREGFYAECPCCGEPVLLQHCGLFYLDEFTDEAKARYEEYLEELRQSKADYQERKAQISQTSETQARETNMGFILERLAPALDSFRFERNDCRSLFYPIDYVIFEGLSARGRVSKILFTDVKTGAARLSAKQKEIRSLVQAKKVQFDVYGERP